MSGPQRRTGAGITGEHHASARRQRQHIASHRHELIVWNFDQPVAAIQEKLPERHRKEP